VVSCPFYEDDNTTVYYWPGTTGWDATFGGGPTVLWYPPVPTIGADFGVRTNQLGFTLIGTNNLVVVVEASTNLSDPTWAPVATNTLTGGSAIPNGRIILPVSTAFARLEAHA